MIVMFSTVNPKHTNYQNFQMIFMFITDYEVVLLLAIGPNC